MVILRSGKIVVLQVVHLVIDVQLNAHIRPLCRAVAVCIHEWHGNACHIVIVIDIPVVGIRVSAGIIAVKIAAVQISGIVVGRAIPVAVSCVDLGVSLLLIFGCRHIIAARYRVVDQRLVIRVLVKARLERGRVTGISGR